jgi:hypothetical protein
VLLEASKSLGQLAPIAPLTATDLDRLRARWQAKPQALKAS